MAMLMWAKLKPLKQLNKNNNMETNRKTYAQIKSTAMSFMRTISNVLSVLIYKDFEGNYDWRVLSDCGPGEYVYKAVCYIQLKAVVKRGANGTLEVITDRAGMQKEISEGELELVYGAF